MPPRHHMPKSIPAVNISATRAEDGTVTATVCNTRHDECVSCELDLVGNAYAEASGRILESAHFDDMNTFEEPEKVKIKPFEPELKGSRVTFTLPPFSVAEITLK